MIATIWRFRVPPAMTADFERAYGPHSDWVRLFRRAGGYAGTELMKLGSKDGVYLTIDRWRSEDDFRAAKASLEPDYAELDRRCEAYTSEETWLGLHHLIET